MDIDFVARILEQRERSDRVGCGTPTIDVSQHRVIRVLHAELHACATVVPQTAQLARIDRIGPGLECQPDDLALRGFVQGLLLKE